MLRLSGSGVESEQLQVLSINCYNSSNESKHCNIQGGCHMITSDKRAYEYQGERYEVTRTSPYSARVTKVCEECDHEDFIVGTMELRSGWLVGRPKSEEGPRGPIDEFALAVDWSCYFLLMECKGVTYVDEFFSESLRTSPGSPATSEIPSSDEAGGTALAQRQYEHEGRDFAVVRTAPDSATVAINCDAHVHHDIDLKMSTDSMREWLISRAGDSLGQDDSFGGDEFREAVEYCCESLLQECRSSLQVDEFFIEDSRVSQEGADVTVTPSDDEGGSADLANRVYVYEEREFEARRTSPDAATVNIRCEEHPHDDIVVGRREGESGWLVGREANPFGPIDTFEEAANRCAVLLVEECETAAQVAEFFTEGWHALQQRLEALAAFLPQFESPDFEFGHMESPSGKMPYYTFSPLASSFIKTCYEMDWVKPFDWAEWMRSSDAIQLRDDPSALEKATFDQLSRLLTVVIRQDRFVEGALGGAFESGLLVGVLRRAAVLAAESG